MSRRSCGVPHHQNKCILIGSHTLWYRTSQKARVFCHPHKPIVYLDGRKGVLSKMTLTGKASWRPFLNFSIPVTKNLPFLLDFRGTADWFRKTFLCFRYCTKGPASCLQTSRFLNTPKGRPLLPLPEALTCWMRCLVPARWSESRRREEQ